MWFQPRTWCGKNCIKEKIVKDLNAKNVVMGLQHTFVMFGATVLVPLITGLDVGVTLFAAGIGTLLFHILTKFKVPVFLGSSFSFLPPIFAIIQETGDLAYATGGILIAGFLYIIVAILFKFVPYDVLHKILPPTVTGPIIILIGLMLANVAIQNADGTFSPGVLAKIGVRGCWAVAGFTFVAGVFVRKALKGFIRYLPVIIALVAGYVLSIIIGIVDFSAVKEAAWVGLPGFMLPKFSGFAIGLTVPVAVVTIVEHFGDVLAIGNVVGKDFIKDPGIHRTLLGDGLATSLSALMGGPANTTYSENTGAVALTGAKDPIIMRIAAIFAIILSLIPKFTSIIGTIPGPVIGGISILLFGMISSIGIKNMVDAKVDMTEPGNLMITAAMLVLGIGGASFSIGPITLQGLGLSAIVGILLNIILNSKQVFKKS
jgi:uracil permease